MKVDPVISVIVAVYNRAEVIQRCIESVASQTYSHVELIVVDGGSTDATVSILKSNSDSIDYWESKLDRGIYHAFNKGVKHATGDWIFFLGSDDYFHDPSILSKAASYLSNVDTQQHRIVYGKVSLVSSSGTCVDEMNNLGNK